MSCALAGGGPLLPKHQRSDPIAGDQWHSAREVHLEGQRPVTKASRELRGLQGRLW